MTGSTFDGRYWRPGKEWSARDRQRWGDRSNELFDEGIPWPDDERLAYLEIVAPHELERETDAA